MSAKFVFTGLTEYRNELRALPAELGGEASAIVIGAAMNAAAILRAFYAQHWFTGTLAKGVTVGQQLKGQYAAAATVRSNSPLAYIFDKGTQARHYVTVNGKQHLTGRMPPTFIFAKTMANAQRLMNGRLKDLLIRHGLTVRDV